jgi:hypothetical protein
VAGRAEHLQQARDNLAFVEHLVRTSPDDPAAMQWAVTAAFYCALHCLEAYLAQRGISCKTHFQRLTALSEPSNAVPPDVYASYEQLEVWSRQARYELRRFKSGLVEHTILAH